jgi:hypothetical protein
MLRIRLGSWGHCCTISGLTITIVIVIIIMAEVIDAEVALVGLP